MIVKPKDTYRVKLTFTTELLGTVPKDREIYASYIGSKTTPENLKRELETVPEKLEARGWTGFHERDGQPGIMAYAVKGFMKSACSMLRRIPGTRSSKLRAHKKIIDGLVFVRPRFIPLNLNGQEMGVLERPLRGQTAQGERVSLARSDTCPAGTTMEFTVEVLGVVTEPLLREWFDYGRYQGLGQWRSSGVGTFDAVITRVQQGNGKA